MSKLTQIHQCKDNSELTPLYPSRGLFLKPISRINVSVHYPELKQSLTMGGKSISSWDIMERVKALVSPELFISLRVVKNTLEFIRFEGDLENREVLKKIISRVDGKTMKVTGFKEPLKIRAAESKLPFPSKYDWDTFFRDAKNMNEMKSGERPDTVHFQNVPCKWFTDDRTSDKPLPSEKIFRRVWDIFGDVRCVDIPMCDPYRTQMTNSIGGIKTFNFCNDNMFEAYVQYRDYMSFVKAMDALRGCFLFYQEGSSGKYWVANLKVDFDKSKHLSDESIRRRKFERERLYEKDKQKKVAEKLSRIEAEVKEKKNHEKEKKESDKNLAKIEYKIEMEERKYLIARRKLEAIRLMDYLFETIKKKVDAKKAKKKMLKEKTKEETKKVEKAMKKYKKNAHISQEEVKSRKSRKADRVSEERSSSSHEQEDRRRNSRDDDYSRHSDSDHHQRQQEDSERDHRRLESDNHQDQMDRERERGEHKVAGSAGGHYSSRYLGDWEVKAKSNLGSEVKVSANYVPIATRSHPSGSYRGRGRFFRGGRGRGGRGRMEPFPHPTNIGSDSYYNNNRRFEGQERPYVQRPQSSFYHNNNDRRYDESNSPYPNKRRRDDYERDNPHPPQSFHENRKEKDSRHENESDAHHHNEPIVTHNYTYLDELDRAYEKYFTSITKRNKDD